MSVRIIDRVGRTLGTLQIPSSALLGDLEALRRLGAYRVEIERNG